MRVTVRVRARWRFVYKRALCESNPGALGLGLELGLDLGLWLGLELGLDLLQRRGSALVCSVWTVDSNADIDSG